MFGGRLLASVCNRSSLTFETPCLERVPGTRLEQSVQYIAQFYIVKTKDLHRGRSSTFKLISLFRHLLSQNIAIHCIGSPPVNS